ncbi:MAG TPA: PFL family protein [Thermoleophilia bacterium]|nr:PFL family protein [Thermoleophilia bacterium]
MVFITEQEILETVAMIRSENLDVRAVTMGISLADCSERDPHRTAERIRAKIVQRAGRLLKVAGEIEEKYGIPIVNKRVSLTPIAQLVGGDDPAAYVEVAHALDAAAEEIGIDFVGGFSAMVQKGFTRGDAALIEAIPEAISSTQRVCSSVNVASTRAGINMDAVVRMADVIKALSKLTAANDSIECAKLVVFCNVPEDNPFMAGALHGSGEPEVSVNVAISGPGVVRNVVEHHPEASLIELADLIKRTTFKITRVGELVAREASQMLHAQMGIIDLSLAPTPAVGDSIAEILESMGLEQVGAPGTTAALAMLNDAVKKGGTMATSSTGGLSGAFIPVSEDAAMAKAAADGVLSIEKLEAMTAVCSLGLDMIVVPGDIPTNSLAGMIADVMAIGMINSKTTGARLIPAYGKKVGEWVTLGGLFGEAPVMAVSQAGNDAFLRRGGRIPAPLQSLTN